MLICKKMFITVNINKNAGDIFFTIDSAMSYSNFQILYSDLRLRICIRIFIIDILDSQPTPPYYYNFFEGGDRAQWRLSHPNPPACWGDPNPGTGTYLDHNRTSAFLHWPCKLRLFSQNNHEEHYSTTLNSVTMPLLFSLIGKIYVKKNRKNLCRIRNQLKSRIRIRKNHSGSTTLVWCIEYKILSWESLKSCKVY